MYIKNRRATWLLATSLSCCVAPPLFAQTATTENEPVPAASDVAAEPNMPSHEIVVTATRRTQALQDVPMSVDVATGEQLQRLNIFDVKDVAQLSPGLELTNTVGRNNNATLRGVESDPDAASATVDFYFNEFPIDVQTAFTAIYDIDQIEVLRGPQGALRGRTAPAGAITLRTRRPDLNDINGYFQATGTDRHGYNVQGGVTLPLVPGTLGLRVAALVDGNRLNNVYNVTRDEWSRSRTQSARISLGWEPSDALSINLMYQYLHADNRQNQQVISVSPFEPDIRGANPFELFPGFTAFAGGSDGRPMLDIDDRVAVSSEQKRFLNRTHLVTLNANWNMGPVSLDVVGGLQRTRLSSLNDLDPANIDPEPGLAQDLIVPYPVENIEARLLSNNKDGFWNWSIGAYYYHQAGDVVVRQVSPAYVRAPIGGGLYFEDRLENQVDLLIPVRSRTFAISGSSQFQFTPKLRLEVAARYADEKGNQSQTGGVMLDPGTGCGLDPDDPCFIDLSRDNPTHDKPLTGGANLVYEFSDNLTVYASFARSFRGGTNAVSGPQFVSSDLLSTPAERSNSYELGFKSSFFDRRVSLNVAIFKQDYSNYITRVYGVIVNEGSVATGTVPDCVDPAGGTTEVACSPGLTPEFDGLADINYAGDLKVKGIEATLSGRPTENWDFSVSAAYVKARYDNAALPCNDIDGDGEPDAVAPGDEAITGGGNVSYCHFNGRPSSAPDFSLTANSEVRFPFGNLEPFLRGVITHRPGVTTINGNTFRSRQLLNVFAGVRFDGGKWELTAFARNLLNQDRITASALDESTASVFGGGPSYRSGYGTVSTTNPREFGITASAKF